MLSSALVWTNRCRASYAARTPARNVPTSPESCSAAWRGLMRPASTMPAALPVSFAALLTPPILVVTSLVASAVCETLRAISAVAAPCSSIAAPIDVAIRLTSSMVAVMPPMASHGFLGRAHGSGRSCRRFRGWLPRSGWRVTSLQMRRRQSRGRLRPARAASMVAFSASRLVCAAML